MNDEYVFMKTLGTVFPLRLSECALQMCKCWMLDPWLDDVGRRWTCNRWTLVVGNGHWSTALGGS